MGSTPFPFTTNQRVKIKLPQMTRMGELPLSHRGKVLHTNGAYIAVQPEHWPEGKYIHFYPSELEQE